MSRDDRDVCWPLNAKVFAAGISAVYLTFDTESICIACLENVDKFN